MDSLAELIGVLSQDPHGRSGIRSRNWQDYDRARINGASGGGEAFRNGRDSAASAFENVLVGVDDQPFRRAVHMEGSRRGGVPDNRHLAQAHHSLAKIAIYRN